MVFSSHNLINHLLVKHQKKRSSYKYSLNKEKDKKVMLGPQAQSKNLKKSLMKSAYD